MGRGINLGSGDSVTIRPMGSGNVKLHVLGGWHSLAIPDGYYITYGVEGDRYFILNWSDSTNSITLGAVSIARDNEQNKDFYVWSHNFRSQRFDSLQDALDITVIKHKMGYFDGEDRQVF